ncbi:C40 family peptidase [Neobacillus sp. D3-1R]|uniref:C40 family peptidase n=1 Tax=Neobacillus sp. D3-1R TaxID=3445778 RepID=UPI003FA1059C
MLKKLIAVLSFSFTIALAAPLMSEAATNSTNTNTIQYVDIKSGTLNVRESASETSAIVTEIPMGKKVYVYSEANGWAHVKVGEYKGYVSAQFLSAKTSAKKTDSVHKKVISAAKSTLGVKYKFGGTSTKGFDCSGFVGYSFKKAGITLPRTAADMQNEGTKVSSLKPGDLLFYSEYKGAKATHVSIYLGNGKMIHSATSKGVSITSIDNSYWKKRFIGAKRV